jgi:branched-chain amino acid transport system ATP-binding protein
MTAPLLSVCGLDAYYGDAQALFQVQLDVEEGKITTLLGPNGVGKTTLLRAVCGMIKRRGEVTFAGTRIDRWHTEDIVRCGISHVPEGRGTFLRLTVDENLLLGGYLRGRSRALAGDIERIFEYFPKLRDRRLQQAGTLSGGEQQMLAISRGLLSRPKLLLLDEPSFGLAPIIVQEIGDILKRINKAEALTVMLVEQNISLAERLTDWVIVLESGRVAMSGSPDLLKTGAAIGQLYLGGSEQ